MHLRRHALLRPCLVCPALFVGRAPFLLLRHELAEPLDIAVKLLDDFLALDPVPFLHALLCRKLQLLALQLGVSCFRHHFAGRLETLDQLLRVKAEQNIYDLLAWQEGSFEFVEGELPNYEMVRISATVSNLVREGGRRIDRANAIKEKIPSLQCVPVRVGPLIDEDDMDMGWREVLEAVDVPVIAAGGVVTGADIKDVLDRGAAGVQMGSRFAATTW